MYSSLVKFTKFACFGWELPIRNWQGTAYHILAEMGGKVLGNS